MPSSLGHDVQLDLVRRQERAAGVDGRDVGGGRVGAAAAHLKVIGENGFSWEYEAANF